MGRLVGDGSGRLVTPAPRGTELPWHKTWVGLAVLVLVAALIAAMFYFFVPRSAHAEESITGIGVAVDALAIAVKDDGKEEKVKIVFAAISEVLPDTPAEVAGLKAYDEIIAIDGRKVSDMAATADVVLAIRGPEGTFVNLTIVRRGEEKEREFRIQRARIRVPREEK